MIKAYTMLTKPGIILGNIITTAGGFALASKGSIDPVLLACTLLGLGCIIASAGVFNSYIDREVDAKMKRTMQRPLVKGTIGVKNALAFGTLLGVCGGGILSAYTNPLALATAIAGFAIYLLLYAIAKYRTFYGTLVGSLAGATPPVVGYVAVSGILDTPALLIFLILLLWQMPHFFAIAIFRIDDYAAASIPVLPIIKGMRSTKIQMLLYIIAFTLATLLLSTMGYTNAFFGYTAGLLGLAWLAYCLVGFYSSPEKDRAWAYKMFAYSVFVITGLFALIPWTIQ